MKFTDYLEERGIISEATLKLADTPKVKKALYNFLVSKIDKQRQRDPEIELIDKTSTVKLKELVDEFAYALGSWTTIDTNGTEGFTGQYGNAKDQYKANKKNITRGDMGTSIIVINMMNELGLNTDKKGAIGDFEKTLTDIAAKNI